jgi:hypothetical protein
MKYDNYFGDEWSLHSALVLITDNKLKFWVPGKNLIAVWVIMIPVYWSDNTVAWTIS